MPTYTNLGIKKINTGDEAGTWGDSTNTNFDYFDTAIVGYVSIAMTNSYTSGAPYDLNVADFAASDGRNRVIEFTGTPGVNTYVKITPNDFVGYYFVRNSVAGGFSVYVFQTDSYDAAKDIEVPNGKDLVIRCDGGGSTAAVVSSVLDNPKFTSPVFVTPVLGTPASGTLTNCTGLPVSTGVSGLGTGVATFLATPSSSNLAAAVTGETGSGALVFGTSPTIASPTLTSPVLGTPSSGTLTNCTGLPVSTGVSGLGTGVATFLATPSSSNLAAAVTGETGSGALVFGTSPTLTTPTISGVATFAAGTDSAPSITTTGDTNTGIFFPDADTIAFTEGGAEAVRIASNGFMGIGTTSPVAHLHVAGSGGGIGLRLQNTSTGGNFVDFVNSDGTVQGNIFYNHASNYMDFGTSDGGVRLLRMRILGNGNIGIGAATPATKLEIAANNTGLTSDTANNTLRFTDTDTTTAADQPIGKIEFYSSDATTSARVGAYILATAQGTSGGGNLEFATATNTGTVTEQMQITGEGDLQFNSGYGSVATAYGCRAWVNFDGTSNSANLTGTYSQSGTTVTVTITSHGYVTGNRAYLDFTSGLAVDGEYEVTVTGANTFTVQQASRTTSGNVTDRRSPIRGSGNISSIVDTATGIFSINFSRPMPDTNYAVIGSAYTALISARIFTGGTTYSQQTNGIVNIFIRDDNSVSVDASTINVCIIR